MQEEAKNLEERIDNLEIVLHRETVTVNAGNIQYSSKELPYGKRSTNIMMTYENPAMKAELSRQKAILEGAYERLLHKQNEVVEWIQNIDKSKTRQIFMYRYIDKKTWTQIAFDMEYNDRRCT